MTAPIGDILSALSALVAIETTNPPRQILADGPLGTLVRERLPGFDISVTDLGNGSIIYDAVRGDPDFLFNVHLDTVPVAQGWQSDPFTLKVTEDRAIGLGACDIKGAAACLMVLAQACDDPMRIILTTDEEAGQSDCIKAFVKDPPSVRQAIIAEPTQCQAISQHRGIFSAVMKFSGVSGHSSEQGKSAVHDAAKWIASIVDHPAATENRFNAGRIEGGVKANMIAASTDVLFGFRNIPGTDRKKIYEEHFMSDPPAELVIRFDGPALPDALEGRSAQAQQRAEAWARGAGLEMGAPVDFFTEAAFFAEAGIPALVLGPGNIEQAHTANEWVALEQLSRIYSLYERIVRYD